MRLFASLALFALALTSSQAQALEIKNVRPCFGPLGATRTDVQCLPGDVLFVTYDIEGLKFDDKTGKANYLTILELFDNKSKQVFKKETPNEVSSQLGGNRMPGDLHVIMGRNQEPGRYHIRLTVADRLSKETKSTVYSFDLKPQSFGMIGVTAPAVGFPGQHYVCSFAIIDTTLDAKKMPNVEVTMKILDETGQAVTTPIISKLPRDLPADIDLGKENFVPMQFPIYLNRTGRFTIDISAADIAGNKNASLRYPLTVLDLGALNTK
ncbi:MAG: hypothetical protein K2X38_10105 [Gemmataceae bacterium]|nr:hypothetical protein [Gemmataceae bacterium]